MFKGYKNVLWLIFLLSLCLNYSGINVNLPSSTRSGLIIPNKEIAAAFAPAMILTRKAVYDSYKLQTDILRKH